MRGYEIAEEAFRAFDHWVSEQDDDVQNMGLIEQINLYAAATSKDQEEDQ